MRHEKLVQFLREFLLKTIFAAKIVSFGSIWHGKIVDNGDMGRRKLTRAAELARAVEKQVLEEAAQECLEEKVKNGGRLPYGFMDRVIVRMGLQTLTRDKVNYRMKTLEAEQAKGLNVEKKKF